ncbi:hypothetical protein EYF80_006376 [Liparis tanakae]|uniref:Uncharacterized protein n=1 Tax=Liparis tanakae TaxID=230148 RepID=A0A4Z2IZE9_9TELE|nr:hypothetical protein EYF80_006376 [Liparis tanakae]
MTPVVVVKETTAAEITLSPHALNFCSAVSFCAVLWQQNRATPREPTTFPGYAGAPTTGAPTTGALASPPPRYRQ